MVAIRRSSLRRNGARTLKFMLEKHCLSISLQIVSSRLRTRKDEVGVGSGFVFSSHLLILSCFRLYFATAG